MFEQNREQYFKFLYFKEFFENVLNHCWLPVSGGA